MADKNENKIQDQRATQVFVLRNVLIKHCGKNLSSNKIDEIMKEIEVEIEKGSCAWAFGDDPACSMCGIFHKSAFPCKEVLINRLNSFKTWGEL